MNESELEKITLLGRGEVKSEYQYKRDVIELFEKQVLLSPNKVAVTFEDEYLTYEQLSIRSNKVANMIKQEGINEGEVVAIMSHRSIDTLVAILGTLKANCVCFPVDPSYPMERINYLIKDSGTKIILHNIEGNYINSFTKTKISIDNADDFSGEFKKLEFNTNEPCYLIYTSGSTGLPKGTLLNHHGIVNHAFTKIDELKLTNFDKVSHALSVNFVASIWMFLSPLFVGASVRIVKEEDMKIPLALFNDMEKSESTILEIVPSTLASFLDYLDEGMFKGNLSKLRFLILTGERLHSDLVERAYSSLRNIKIINAYGQSECSDDTLHYHIPRNQKFQSIPVGRPAHNTQVYLLNHLGQIQMIGYEGELVISGSPVSNGYLNKPKITEESFVEDTNWTGRAFRTGDIVKWKANGNLEYIGRKDDQVKIRGYRIEIGEIEAVIKSLDEVKEVVVIPDKSKYEISLTAFVVCKRKNCESQLRNSLEKLFPVYMIPSKIVQINCIPRSPNGKVDRHKLKELFQKKESINNKKFNFNLLSETDQKIVKLIQEVLKNPSVDPDSNFIGNGGNSLNAAFLSAKIQKELHIDLPISDFFTYNIRELLEKTSEIKRIPVGEIPSVSKSMDIPLSPNQMGIFTLDYNGDANTAYNLQLCLQFNGSLNKLNLKNALDELVDRHSVFRSYITLIEEGTPVQRVIDKLRVKMEYIKINENLLDKEINSFIRPFNLEQAPLIRVGLFELHSKKHVLVVDMHHIITDGLSCSHIVQELIKLYEGQSLSENKNDYFDYVIWENNKRLKSDFKKQQEKYYLREFSGELPKLNLPTDFSRPNFKNFKGDSLIFNIDSDNMKFLKRLAKKTSTTLNMITYAFFEILLYKYTGQDDFIVGTTVAGRSHSDLWNIVGMFVNTVPIRSKLNPNENFEHYLTQVREKVIGSIQNQEYPFDELVKKVIKERDISRNPIFDVMFVYEKQDQLNFSLKDCEVNLFQYFHPTSKFDLTFEVTETQNGNRFRIEYNSELFKPETIKRMSAHYQNLIKSVLKNCNQKISEIELLSNNEKSEILNLFNQTDAKYNEFDTIVSVFEDQVRQTPSNIAVRYNDDFITYEQLNNAANRIAADLIDNGIKPNELVGIMMEKSINLIIGILGIIKSGAAYVPLDPTYPEDRILYMLNDSKCKLLMIDSVNSLNSIPSIKIINIMNNLSSKKENNKNLSIKPNDIAYIIYTSGSTGDPKGVMINHRNVVRLLKNDRLLFDFNSDDVWTMFHSHCFDFSVWEMYGALLNGGTLIVIPKEKAQDPSEFLDIIQKNEVTVLNQTPTAFYNLSEYAMNAMINQLSVRYIIFGGEALFPIHLKPWHEKFNNTKFINMYGITETTVHVTFKEIKLEDMNSNISNIGVPIPTLKVLLLDSNKNLVPIGVPGEIYVIGDGVASGYLNRPELTAERFITNRFNNNEIMYKSGDLAKWLPNGELEYLGRVDHQVKIRGYRIELGEITTILLKHDNVKEAFVTVSILENGNKSLCAYYVAEGIVSQTKLRNYLNKLLPSYMVPSYFVNLESMPLTVNGKVDRRALPEPTSEFAEEKEHVSPRNDIEMALENVWCSVLSLPKVSINSNFFEIGGDSIKAIQVSARLSNHNLHINIKDIFKFPRIKDLSHLVKKGGRLIPQASIEGDIPLTPIQSWYFEKEIIDFNYWNQSTMLFRKNGFDIKLIQQILEIITKHHDILRATYNRNHEGITQSIKSDDKPNFEYSVCNLSYDSDIEKTIRLESQRLQSSINIEEGPLLHAKLFKSYKGDYILIAIHHLVIDGVSWRILLEDFVTIYKQLMQNATVKLQQKTNSYLDWSKMLKKYVKSESHLLIDKEYWRSICSNPLLLPKDKYQVSENKYKTIRSIEFNLGVSATDAMLTNVLKYYDVEINVILLTALSSALYDWTGKSEFLINMEGHGREILDGNIDVSRTIGWFTSIFPLSLSMNPMADISDRIFIIQRRIDSVPNKGITYGLIKYISDLKDDYLEITPQLTFNYLGQLDGNLGLGIERSKFSTGEEISPENKRSELIEIESYVIDRELKVTILYSQEQYFEDTIKNIGSSFIKHLEKIVSSTSTKPKVGTLRSLEEITPFNDIFYRDCFYSALLPVINYFEGDMNSILINDVPVFEYSDSDNGGQVNFDIEYYSFLSIEKLLRNQGIKVSIQKPDDILEAINESILSGNPVIIGVDCYYASFRKDTYLKNHWPHTILITGINMQTKTVDIIEHEEINSMSYRKIKVPTEDILKCYKSFLENFYDPNDSPSFYEFSNCGCKKSSKKDIENIFKTNYRLASKFVDERLKLIPKIVNQIKEILVSQDNLDENLSNMKYSIANILYAKRAELYKYNRMGITSEITNIVKKVIDRWDKSRLILERYSITKKFDRTSLSKIAEYLEETEDLEQEYFKTLMDWIN